ncbi:hypothetical protein HELRODRAFT_160631 [Helobdella robusta]|uniref:Uncharacterized protein n=1 Tax=Helobdella robusta TaxID=6412 RepID=T1EQI8_HELRO|nr:hypothetical protein HELRODRAFT_160631 [Helobdella robusta]ESO06459.1 hypothetical protein HELRODRAFT_160631 [Helobdella robusta]
MASTSNSNNISSSSNNNINNNIINDEEPHLLKNFASTNRNLFPILSKVIDLEDISQNDGRFLYNPLSYHKVQTGSLLVMHGWTRHLKVLARTSNDKYFTIPLNYQGTFKVKLRACNSLEELISHSSMVEGCQDYSNKQTSNVSKANKPIDKVRVVDIDKKFTGGQIKIGDIVRVICEKVASNEQFKAPQVGEIVLDDTSHQSDDGDDDSVLMFYQKLGRVRLEKMDFESGKAMEIAVPLDLNITFEEVIETTNPSKRLWTIGELSNLIQRHSVFVEVVKGSKDHQTLHEDLPLKSEIEMVQVLAEPSLYVSELNPEAPAFHVPTRMKIYLKFHKQLSKKSSPFLSKTSQPLISTLDRCVEHIDSTTFRDLLQRKLNIDSFLKVSQAINKSSRVSTSSRQDYSVARRALSIADSSSSSKSSRWGALSGSWKKHFTPSQKLPRSRSFTADSRSQRSSMSMKQMISAVSQNDVRSISRYPSSTDRKKKGNVVYLVSASKGPSKVYKVQAPDITVTPPTPRITTSPSFEHRSKHTLTKQKHRNLQTIKQQSSIQLKQPTYRQQFMKASTDFKDKQQSPQNAQESSAAVLIVDSDDDRDLVDSNALQSNLSINSHATHQGSSHNVPSSSLDLRSSVDAINNYTNNYKTEINCIKNELNIEEYINKQNGIQNNGIQRISIQENNVQKSNIQNNNNLQENLALNNIQIDTVIKSNNRISNNQSNNSISLNNNQSNKNIPLTNNQSNNSNNQQNNNIQNNSNQNIHTLPNSNQLRINQSIQQFTTLQNGQVISLNDFTSHHQQTQQLQQSYQHASNTNNGNLILPANYHRNNSSMPYNNFVNSSTPYGNVINSNSPFNPHNHHLIANSINALNDEQLFSARYQKQQQPHQSYQHQFSPHFYVQQPNLFQSLNSIVDNSNLYSYHNYNNMTNKFNNMYLKQNEPKVKHITVIDTFAANNESTSPIAVHSAPSNRASRHFNITHHVVTDGDSEYNINYNNIINTGINNSNINYNNNNSSNVSSNVISKNINMDGRASDCMNGTSQVNAKLQQSNLENTSQQPYQG